METNETNVELVDGTVATRLARAALLAALMGAFAYVQIPLPISPVPVTLQVLGVFLAGIFLGPYWGALSLVFYLVAGAAGAPIFAGGTAGIGVLFAESGGFLWSYPVGALLVGGIVHRGRELRDPAAVRSGVVAFALLVATTYMYALGVGWMAWVLELEIGEAIAVGAAPFVPGELLKIVVALAIAKSGVVDPTE